MALPTVSLIESTLFWVVKKLMVVVTSPLGAAAPFGIVKRSGGGALTSSGTARYRGLCLSQIHAQTPLGGGHVVSCVGPYWSAAPMPLHGTAGGVGGPA